MSDAIKNEGRKKEWEELKIGCPRCPNNVYIWTWKDYDDEIWCKSCHLRGRSDGRSSIKWDKF